MPKQPYTLCVKNQLGDEFKKHYEASEPLRDAVKDIVKCVEEQGNNACSITLKSGD